MTEAQNPLTPRTIRLTPDFTTNLPTPSRALAIGAHPDDIDFACGATLAKWAAAGCRVDVLVCTDGSKGTWDPDADRDQLVATRQAEQQAAARTLGATGEVHFLDHTDGELVAGPAERNAVAHMIRLTTPDVVLGHDPWKRYRLHPDHRNAGWMTVDGLVAAREPKFTEIDLPAHRPDHLLLFEADAPDHGEDVTGLVDVKYRALLAHESQFESTMHQGDDPELIRFRQQVEARLTEAGQAMGVTHAEVFKLIDDL